MIFKIFFTKKQVQSKSRPSKLYLKNKERARDLVINRLESFNSLYGYKWGRISIKNTRRRWGSCSRKGNLNFCYRIAFLPPDLADYVIVHELCHLGQFNHSGKFWALVERALPEYRTLRKRLMNESGKFF